MSVANESNWTAEELRGLADEIRKYADEHEVQTPYGRGTNFLFECVEDALRRAAMCAECGEIK